MKPDTILQQAQTLERNGQLQDAEALYRQLVAADPNYHPAWQALGLLAFGVGKLPVAAQCFEAAIAGNPKIALYHRNVGELYRRLGQLDKAIAAGRRAVKLAPGDLDAHYNLGLACFDAKDLAQAVQLYRKALRIDERHGLSWNNLGSALEQQGDKDAAQEAYARAIAIDPRHAEAQNNLGAILSERGQVDAARACFEAAIAAQPDFVEAHFNLSSLKTYTRTDPHFAALERLHAQRAQLSDAARIRYDFAFGKALDDVGDYDRAFGAFAEGNQLQHARTPIDEPRADHLLQNIIDRFDADFFAARKNWRSAADPQRTPVFIVGMPRSGTTLLEQILCTHASVFGAGELAELHQAVELSLGAEFAERAATATETTLRELGEHYLQQVWKLAPDSAFVTDKMPANFFYIGLIHLALPHAKIIHIARDPMDSCFSCYTRLFNDTMEFAYDQGTLGRYYRRYHRLMAHWRDVLPADSFLDLHYEDLIADTEGQARRVLDFIGLPWDDAVLQFHTNDRLVKTASMAQVRKPIYKTSVARWKHYAQHLQPLYALVRELRPVDDAPPALATPLPNLDEIHQAGIAAYHAGRFDDALAHYDRILAVRPDTPEVLNSKGFSLQDKGDIEAARTCFARAVEIAPGLAMARMNLAFAQLKLGEWEQGWENYEVRWTGSAEASRQQFGRPACPLPQWNGESGTSNQRIIVFIEQGFGDTFQFCRFIGLLTERFAKVGFACSAPVLRLMDWSFGDKVVLISQMPNQFDDWDWQCPMMSLPRAFRTRPDTIPAALPYLRVQPAMRDYWAGRLERAAPNRMRVGIAWAGRPAYQYDARRSLPFAKLVPLLQGAGVSWINLQKWRPDDAPAVLPAGVHWLDWTAELNDFADTAALVANLDLIVSIDSALVHLAGALDKPVYMLDRFDNEWRWFHNRLDSPWYPRLRAFRQERFGEWAGPIAQVLAELPAASAAAPARATASDIQNLHAQGIAAYQAGQLDAAIQLLLEAIARGGDIATLHSDVGEMCRQRGRVDEAIEHGERAVALAAAMPAAHSNLGIAYFDRGELERAENCQRRALQLAPQFVPALNNLGSICRERGDLPGAIAWYDQALAAAPDHVEALSNRGAVLTENGRPADALASLQRALELAPHNLEASCNLGLTYNALHRHEEARAQLQQVLQAQPNAVHALLGMAANHLEEMRPEEAETLARRAVELAPAAVDGYVKLGQALSLLGRSSEAEAAYARALELKPTHGDAQLALAHLRLEQGRKADALATLDNLLAHDANNVLARFHIAKSAKVQAGDANFAALRQRLDAIRSGANPATDAESIALHFALGKCFDDTGNAAEAFAHYAEGNRRKRATLRYDAAAASRQLEDVRRFFTADKLRELGLGKNAARDSSPRPIFVLGMPRSGTTLIEQILSSHPRVHGAGELTDLLQIAQRPTAQRSITAAAVPSYPHNLTHATAQTLAIWGAEYRGRLQQRAPAAAFITDKMPTNFYALGPIRAMLPDARIVHVRRDPLDTCLSNFMHLFNTKQEHTYDLAELGRYYADYETLMAHWRAVLPADSFIDVQYEDVVADLEGQARRLLDHCGLEWNDACLEFHNNTRDVRTASVMQVRQPLYGGSVGRWRQYEEFLGPLRAALASQHT